MNRMHNVLVNAEGGFICFLKIMLQMHKAEDITLCMRVTAVRMCNFIESPSGFVFICAFVEQDVLPRRVDGVDGFESAHFTFS